ncbi:BppU family phage baseplate upper protein [Clostridium perfringens]|nr:BppU family phage baseplate upper protein [Clostridium perfringens]
MKEIYINADDYNTDSIKTIQGNNNAEEYKIYLQADNEKIDLTGKTVNLGFLRVGSTEGDIIENLNVTNPPEGEITLKITNKLTKRNGTYSCQLAISGKDDFLEHTATFTLTVENNIFKDITKAIADSKDFTYLENILDKASKLSEKLKENTSTATNINSNLESNITEANNINSKLLENTSTATGLNKNLESNIDLAKEVKETIKDLDTKNIEATSKIERLEGLNAKAEELSNNINEALPVKDALVKNTEEAKAANTNLLAANQEATSKNTELQASLEKTKEFIDGLDGSQNIPQLRLDVDALQNGLKSNQSLAYTGSSISADNTLEGRTECMKIKGKTLLNLIKDGKGTFVIDKSKNQYKRIYTFKTNYSLVRGKKYSGYIKLDGIENVTSGLRIYGGNSKTGVSGGYISCADKVGVSKFTWNSGLLPENVGEIDVLYLYIEDTEFNNSGKLTFSNFMLFEEGTDLTYIDEYFEGLKSLGEAEKEGDKYKISILSHGKNLYKGDDIVMSKQEEKWRVVYIDTPNFEIGKFYKLSYSCNETAELKIILTYANGHERYISSVDYIHIESGYGNVVKTRLYIEDSVFQTNKKIIFSNIQIEEGKVETSYEQYKENKKGILIKEPLRDYDVIYEDYGKVKVYREAKKYVITGNEEWSQYVDNSDFTCMGFFLQLNKDFDAKLGGKFICNNFKGSDTDVFPGNITVDDEIIFVKGRSGEASPSYIKISILKSKLTTQNVEGFKEWLKANPTEVVYQLATPVTEIVENCVDIDLDTFGEKTYFNILNSLPGSLDFKVPSNIASIVQNTAREVNNIWDVINNLLVPSLIDINKNVAMSTIKNNLK